MAPVKAQSRAPGSSKRKASGTSKSPQVAKLAKAQKTRRPTHPAAKKKAKALPSAESLGIAPLNTIVPAGVKKPRGSGKRRGKVFIDDAETQMAILALVNAEVDGVVEGKVGKARKLEEIREARKQEAEFKEKARRGKLEQKKDEMRQGRRRTATSASGESERETTSRPGSGTRKRKSVTFA
ncbi:MAG: hypothetical protein M1825_003840 [Sarcosagium campestre]|nr:MAG: hypothetical protein M1825_003840 [Sarcosagium campestre]